MGPPFLIPSKAREPYGLEALPGNTSSLEPNLHNKELRVNSVPSLRSGFQECCSNFIQSLHIMYAGNLSQSCYHPLQVLHVFNVDYDVDRRLAICRARLNVADVGLIFADHSRKLLEHGRAIFA